MVSPKNKNLTSLLTCWLKPKETNAKERPISTSAPRRTHLSEDIFASTSESEVEANEDPPAINISSTSASVSPPADEEEKSTSNFTTVDLTNQTQSNDSIANVLNSTEFVLDSVKSKLTASQITATKNSTATRKQLEKSNISPPTEKPRGSRQRSLLEMLDQCYTTKSNNGPATKRACLSKISNPNSTPTKQQ